MKISTIGLIMIGLGIILFVLYGIYSGFEEIAESFNILTGIFAAIIIIGFLVLLISIIIEQRRDTQKMKKEIKEEDLKP